MVLINAGFYTAGVISSFFLCRPLEKEWNFWVKGTCDDQQTRDVAASALNLVIDIFILALPQRIIWNLQMSMRRRIGVSIVFSVGLLYVLILCHFLPFGCKMRGGTKTCFP